MVCAGNERDDLVDVWDGDGSHGSKVKNFFLERYMTAYRREFDHFLDVIELGRTAARKCRRWCAGAGIGRCRHDIATRRSNVVKIT